jgi:hypothetical protein
VEYQGELKEPHLPDVGCKLSSSFCANLLAKLPSDNCLRLSAYIITIKESGVYLGGSPEILHV